MPYAVAAYITAAYWFTASTSFANPAVTLARAASDTFAGIRPSGRPRVHRRPARRARRWPPGSSRGWSPSLPRPGLTPSATARARVEGIRSRAAHYGWSHRVATLCVTETITWGIIFYGFPVFLGAMEQDLGASRVVVTGAFSLGLSGRRAGGSCRWARWLDRRGARLLMNGGLLSRQPRSPCCGPWSRRPRPSTRCGYSCGIAMATTLYEPAFAAIVQWFPTGRDRALLTVTIAAGFASTIFMPIEAWLLDAVGWRRGAHHPRRGAGGHHHSPARLSPAAASASRRYRARWRTPAATPGLVLGAALPAPDLLDPRAGVLHEQLRAYLRDRAPHSLPDAVRLFTPPSPPPRWDGSAPCQVGDASSSSRWQPG